MRYNILILACIGAFQCELETVLMINLGLCTPEQWGCLHVFYSIILETQ